MDKDKIISEFEDKLGIKYEEDSINLANRFVSANDIVIEGGGGIGIVTGALWIKDGLID